MLADCFLSPTPHGMKLASLYGFVGNYAPCGLSPQSDGMPVIQNTAMVGVTIGSLFGLVIGVSLSLMPIKYTSTAIASTLMAIVPILIIPVSIIFFKEEIKANEVIGTLVGLLGVAVIFMG